ncbi:hypothetical protein ACQKG5_25710, partial [Serratia bockelmannii]|uniref:hypothetical protein n=1 Tax=Serratia bockelmannii TaxID=2703793 RepID=UPI003D0656E1
LDVEEVEDDLGERKGVADLDAGLFAMRKMENPRCNPLQLSSYCLIFITKPTHCFSECQIFFVRY